MLRRHDVELHRDVRRTMGLSLDGPTACRPDKLIRQRLDRSVNGRETPQSKVAARAGLVLHPAIVAIGTARRKRIR
jgi:hypothetical protein